MKLLKILVILGLLFGSACSSDDEVNVVDPDEDDDDITELPLNEVPQTRIDYLKKGVNLGHWFAQTSITEASLNSRFNDADFDFIENSGFTYVRLSIDESVLIAEEDYSQVNPQYLTILEDNIQKFIDRDIAVLFDFHTTDEFKNRVHEDIIFANKIKQFWGVAAKHFKKYDPDMLYFEVFNEPWTLNAEEWYDMQEDWVKVIRSNAPLHTIVVDGNLRVTENNWDDVEAFILQKPLDDKNIVYNLHCYAPMAFTHQAATWGWTTLQYIEGLEWPANTDNANSVKNNANKVEVTWAMDDYLRINWNKDELGKIIKKVGDWQKKYNVPVTCNEFGVYEYKSPKQSRLLYTQDMREALEENNIGWAVWEYDAGFKVIDRRNGQVVWVDGMQSALGL
ncbi:glycoside hydrolase family 5 protein [Flammeovirga yaeyamensis]|uniref:Glycoside hydrolase family 5 protein n=1 Tax=Flammeovirga yaeyamensis TaxID=367791 RepID=A0AAX1NAC3_9BACT|nr:cellulase family glycosylhydrolase [Flammeovirga yaeyamensis]MBB3697811.1 endoglucanase [Flammeovirga yaeyamensis]NMF35833.1 glycoside hydrolase family 5 protein [Flammeovirga yaeyamensis]QWG03215.1 glycoside hydrolase family 5 protein [Flammeovirga yaeyamensis]